MMEGTVEQGPRDREVSRLTAGVVVWQDFMAPGLRSRRRAAWAKRTFDVAVGGALGLLTLPLIVVLAAGSAVILRTWPFFMQERIGRYGRHFRFVKIRTLPRTTNAYALKLNLDQSNLPAYCRALRRLHLDELPQLWLVLFGRMSLVGPRPRMPDVHEPAEPVYATCRALVPQGCTGLWQVGTHISDLPGDCPQYDHAYLRWGGVRLDLWVLWRTALVMTGLGRPVPLEDIPPWVRGRGLFHISAR